MRFSLKGTLLLLALLFAGAFVVCRQAVAQSSSGTIQGTVKDSSGAVVAGAKVGPRIVRIIAPTFILGVLSLNAFCSSLALSLARKLTHTPFSVSSLLGLLTLLGVSVETGVILVLDRMTVLSVCSPLK